MQKPALAWILPPDGLAPEDWLAQYDTVPCVTPAWPDGEIFVIIVVWPAGPETRAALVNTREMLEGLAKGGDSGLRLPGGEPRHPRLFFRVPRDILSDPGVEFPSTI